MSDYEELRKWIAAQPPEWLGLSRDVRALMTERDALVARLAELQDDRDTAVRYLLSGPDDLTVTMLEIDLEKARAEVDRLRKELSESELESGDRMQTVIREHRRADAAEAEVARLRERFDRIEALFAGGPDPICRTTWEDGVECVVVPMESLRAALEVDHG